jgi:hypothetical protein
VHHLAWWQLPCHDQEVQHPGEGPAFIRFESAHPSATGQHVGIFGLINVLGRAGMLSPEEDEFRRTANAWYERAYPDPGTIDPAIYNRSIHPETIAWFKQSAYKLLDNIPSYLAVLDAHNVSWRKVISADPGRVIYEDEYHIIVVPT